MTVAELICKELGVKVGERFEFRDYIFFIEEDCIVGASGNVKWYLNSDLMEDILSYKDEVIKINSLADSWDVKEKEEGHFINSVGKVFQIIAFNEIINKCNINKNKEYMQLIADKQNLFKKMLRFADCNNCNINAYTSVYIYFDTDLEEWGTITSGSIHEFSTVYFESKEIAEKALEEFRGELEGIRLSEIKLRGG